MHWRAQCHAKWPRGKRNRAHLLRFTLTTKLWNRVSWLKKNSTYLEVFRNLQPLFWVQDCRSQVVQVEYQGKARNTRILERKPLIDTSYWFDIDLPSWVEIVSLRTIFAQCSSSSSSTSEKWEVRTWNLGQIFDRVMDGWSVTQPMIVYKDKKNQSLRLDIYKLVVQSIKTFFYSRTKSVSQEW